MKINVYLDLNCLNFYRPKSVKDEIESLPIKVSKEVISEWLLNCVSFISLNFEKVAVVLFGDSEGGE